MINKIALLIFVGLLSVSMKAQKTFTKDHPDENFRKGIEMFNKQMYGLSQLLLDDYYDNTPGASSLMLSDARFYSSACALELFNTNAEIRLNEFVANNPESSRKPDALYRLGISNFRNKEYPKVLDYFQKVDPFYLSEEESAEYYFKLGYSNFATEKLDEASKAFYEIKDKETKYSIPAIYFYSHIAYVKKNFEPALQGFQSIANDELFAPIIPYYISHIYFLQEKYQEVVEYAPPMLDSVNAKRKPDLARLIGESYYRMNKFSEAMPYLEEYIKTASDLTREDYFQMGFCYHVNGKYAESVSVLSKISNESDLISQNSAYVMGSCYLHLNDKKSARLAFESAAKTDFDKRIQEESMFNFAKLTQELAISPFNEAINSFNIFIAAFPNSKYLDESYNYLSKVYMSTQNYDEAIVTLENIQKITPETEEAYQRVTFFRALELFSNSEFEDAIINFDKSLNNAKYNRIYQARSIFWKAESYYRLNRVKDAARDYNKFLVTAGAFELKEFNTAHYNLGYCYFKQKDYLEAASWFRKYTDMMKDANSKTVGDAYARTGDCYFASREYDKASTYYQKAVDNGKASVDYAIFQKGFCLGLIKEHNQKIILMNQLITDYSRSSLVDDAWLEIGNSYVAIEEHDMAINSYQQLINDYPTSNLVPKAYLQIGLVYYNTDKNEKALEVLKKVVDFFPNTQESQDALASLKNVYLELNQVEEYYTYIKEKDSKIDIRITEQDSLTYNTCVKVYMNAEYEKASNLFIKYIDKFKEQGIFYPNANYYLAESYIQMKKPEQAAPYYSNVLSKPATEFTEPSLAFLGYWYFETKEYQKALDYYTRLEDNAQYENNKMAARSGKMRSHFMLNNLPEARKAAINLLSAGKISDELFREAHFIIGKDAMANNSLEDARDEFDLISKDCKSAEQAEAKYLVAKIYFTQSNFEDAEKEIFDFVKKNTPHQYWLGKSFLLLSEIYIQRKDNFQSKATLQSVIDNYKNKTDGIIEEATKKLQEITAAELKASQPEPSLEEGTPDMEINLDNSKTE